MAGVEAHKSIARIPGDNMAKRLNHGQLVGNFRKFAACSIYRLVSNSRIHNFGTKTNEVCHVVLLI